MKVTALRKKLALFPGSSTVVVVAPDGPTLYPIVGVEIDRWTTKLIAGERGEAMPCDQVRNAVTPDPPGARKAVAKIPDFDKTFDSWEREGPTIHPEAPDVSDISDYAGMDGHQTGGKKYKL